MKRVRQNLFKRGQSFVYRHQDDGKDRWVTLGPVSQRKALEMVDKIREKTFLSKLGLSAAPSVGKKFTRISQLVEFYLDADCPKLDGRKRGKANEQRYRTYCRRLSAGLGNVRLDQFNSSKWNGYVATAEKQGRGPVAIDSEMITLRTAWTHATKFPDETGVTDVPSFRWHQRRRQRADVYHCRERQPENANELHEIAAHFFNRRIDQCSMGWFVLMQSMIGCRASELLKLRTDAKTRNEPGFDDGEHLWLYRSKTHKGTSPFAKIHPELREVLDAHRNWHSVAFPRCPWFFPSCRVKAESKAIGAFAVASAFAGIHKATGKDRTSHGLRSYYVNVRRSQGATDAEIALEIGHKTTKLIVETYGEILPIKIGWRPDGPPAWERFADRKAIARPAFG